MSDQEMMAATLARASQEMSRMANAAKLAEVTTGGGAAATDAFLTPPATCECSLCATRFAKNELFIMSSERFGGSRYGTACAMCKYDICFPCVLALSPPVFPCPYCRSSLGAQVGPLPAGFVEWRVSEKKAFDDITDAHAVVSGAYEEAVHQLSDMRRVMATLTATGLPLFPRDFILTLDDLVDSGTDEDGDEDGDDSEDSSSSSSPDDGDAEEQEQDEGGEGETMPTPERPAHPSPDSARRGGRLLRVRNSRYPSRRMT